MDPKEKLFFALDVPTIGEAILLVELLKPHVGGFKVGLEQINSMLASVVVPEKMDEAIDNLQVIRILFGLIGGKFFFDEKIHDIPNTLGAAAKAISSMKPKFFNFHASAGVSGAQKVVANKGDSKTLGVTVLTSHEKEECESIFGGTPGDKVLQFAKMLVAAKVDGIICSPQELKLLREHPELDSLIKVIPGIRPDFSQKNDQKRTMTPKEAIELGADYLVAGRPIKEYPAEKGGPVEAAKLFAKEIASARIQK